MWSCDLILESEAKGNLEPPRWLGRDRLAEKWRRQHSDIALVVDVIEEVECIHSQRGDCPLILLRPAEIEVAGPSPVYIGIARALQAVAGHTWRPRVRHPRAFAIPWLYASVPVVSLYGIPEYRDSATP